MRNYELSFRFKGSEKECQIFLDALRREVLTGENVVLMVAPIKKISPGECFCFLELSLEVTETLEKVIKSNSQVVRYMLLRKAVFSARRRKGRIKAKIRGERRVVTEKEEAEEKKEAPIAIASLEEKLKEILKE